MHSHKAQSAGKLEDHATRGIYVGMRNGLFRIYFPATNKLIETGHILFDWKVQSALECGPISIDHNEEVASEEWSFLHNEVHPVSHDMKRTGMHENKNAYQDHPDTRDHDGDTNNREA